MSRPTFEVADLIHAQGARFVDQHRQHLSYQQLKVLRAIAQCRTAALGGHIDDCPRCSHQAISYNSCLMESNSLWRVGLPNRRSGGRFEHRLSHSKSP